ncbi:Uncharacterised protein [Bordetella bronchiseptica]|nr:Uncharacterised protein [Bordetella bronchiseptica]VEI26797.1 Uncharacterised protein [Bordetella bronchiseptica]
MQHGGNGPLKPEKSPSAIPQCVSGPTRGLTHAAGGAVRSWDVCRCPSPCGDRHPARCGGCGRMGACPRSRLAGAMPRQDSTAGVCPRTGTDTRCRQHGQKQGMSAGASPPAGTGTRRGAADTGAWAPARGHGWQVRCRGRTPRRVSVPARGLTRAAGSTVRSWDVCRCPSPCGDRHPARYGGCGRMGACPRSRLAGAMPRLDSTAGVCPRTGTDTRCRQHGQKQGMSAGARPPAGTGTR